jgi:hypothetical protein
VPADGHQLECIQLNVLIDFAVAALLHYFTSVREFHTQATHEKGNHRSSATVLALETPAHDNTACTQLAPYAFKRV